MTDSDIKPVNVRGRLVLGSVSIALIVLSLFGFVAHRAALDASWKQEYLFLQDLVTAQAEVLGVTIPEVHHREDVRQWLKSQEQSNIKFFIVHANGELMSAHEVNENPYGIFSQALLRGLVLAEENMGHSYVSDMEYTWARSPIVNTHLSLLVIHRASEDVPSFSSILGKRLMVTAAIVIWLAIWVALIVSGRIVRRLDEQNKALFYQARHDELTGLPNRNHLMRVLHKRMLPKAKLSLLMLNIDNLHEINDTLGHQAGDDLIKVASERIKNAVPATTFISRLSGAKFAVLLSHTKAATVDDVIQSLSGALNRNFRIKDIEVLAHCRIGFAVSPSNAEEAVALYRCAEVAMHSARKLHQDFQQYDKKIDPYSVEQLALTSALQQAIEGNQLQAYYQPKVDLKTMRTTGVETLLRWKHPEFGQIAPDIFIPLAEKTHLIDELTLWVLDESLRQCRAWHDEGLLVSVAVNFSVRNLQDRNIIQKIKTGLNKWHLNPVNLKIEITESMIMTDPEQAMDILTKLSDMGVKISIDDFGTGYSSLSYLKRLPISEIKIDRSFVMDMLVNNNDRVIVKTIIDLAHDLGCIAVAEGIENEETLSQLIELGCDIGQGYFVSHPVPIIKLDSWINDSASAWPVESVARKVRDIVS